jgi:16S rRNA A1518/A1519 N6-dimethyltransferase RsmA/KsgA/DIM1 with predicted DNA glycosylase/AP lyase activity
MDAGWLDAYLPIPREAIAAVVALARVTPGQRHCELGSGDGRLCVALAHAGALSTGIEWDAELVRKSRAQIAARGLQARCQIVEGSVWEAEWTAYEVLTTGNCANATRARLIAAYLARCPWPSPVRLLVGHSPPWEVYR